MDARAERAQLEEWIATSLAFRRGLRVVSIPALVIAIAIYMWSTTPGIVALLIVAVVWGCGWWITYGHISDWRNRMEILERRARSERADPSPARVD
jgi:uncharacterized membrane-anchored protein